MYRPTRVLKISSYLFFPAIICIIVMAGCSTEREVKQPVRSFKLTEHPVAFVEVGFDFDDVAGELEILGDLRPGFFMGDAHAISFDVPAPGMGLVRFAYGFGPDAHKHSGVIELWASVETGDEEYKIGVWKADPRNPASSEQWNEAVARWPGDVTENARLTFTVEGLLDREQQETFFLAHPVIISETNSSERKHIIVINATALRRDHLGCYGYDRATSANIDAFANENTYYKACYATSPWSFPSAASVLSGLIPSKSVTTGEEQRIRDDISFLPEMLSAEGYATMSLHGSRWLGQKTGMHRGFDRSHVFINTHAVYVFEAAEDWLSMHADENLFAFINLAETGLPYVAPFPYRGMFDPEYEGEFKSFYSEKGYYAGGKADYPDDVREHIKALYDEEVYALDQALGGFFEFLKSSGMYDDSLIIITGLHGEELFEHGGLGHGHQLYAETLNVPLMVRGEGFIPGQVAFLRSPMDIFPSILEWLDMEIPGAVDGVSLLVLHDDGSEQGISRREIPAGNILNGPEMKSLTSSKYHYIYHTDDLSEELFSSIDDPMMLNDIAGANPHVVEEFRGKLVAAMGEMEFSW